MAQRYHKINIKDSMFPLLSEQQGRSVIGATSEEIYDKGTKPGLYYCHNVMPTVRGLDSVSYKELVTDLPNIGLQDVRELYSVQRKRLYVAWNAQREMYFLSDSTMLWVKVALTTPVTAAASYDENTVTIGTVNGVSYIFYSGIGAFTFDSDADTLVFAFLTGIAGTITNYLGVVASSGYLIAYTANALAWSSTIDPTDFTPSEVTGGGGGNVAGIGGAIKFCLSNSLGILIYSDTNVIAGTYTGNIRYPFKFREVDNSKGALALSLIASDSNSAAQFVFSKAGLQTVTSQKADTVLPEVTDFLAGKRFEDFDELTSVLTQLDLTSTLKKKLSFISARYLVISYGVTGYTHALVYDLMLERLGKLKIAHTDCFEYIQNGTGAQIEIAKESLAFLTPAGGVQLLEVSSGVTSKGVLLLGKFQYTRTRTITLLEVELETIRDGSTIVASDLYSLDGKTVSSIQGLLSYAASGIRKFVFRATAINHTLQIVGQFNLTTLIITYLAAGKR